MHHTKTGPMVRVQVEAFIPWNTQLTVWRDH
jgi:hypothetical protein